MKKDSKSPDRVSAFVTPEAHAALPRLCEILAEEKGLRGISYLDAASIAVIEALKKREGKRGKTPTQTKGN